MKTIISASKRTDIPAHYYEWLQSCLSKGYLISDTGIVELNPSTIHSIVLWSKDFSKVAQDAGQLDNFNLYFQYTINNYSKAFEPNVPSFNDSIETLINLRSKYRAEQFNIRFDPIIISNVGEKKPTPKQPYLARLNAFEELCEKLDDVGMENCRITTSYISEYSFVKTKMDKTDRFELMADEQQDFFEKLLKIARTHGHEIYSCANPILEGLGYQHGRCIDGELLSTLFGENASKSKDVGQRKECGCAKAKDIGSYNQVCKHRCLYCYATK